MALAEQAFSVHQVLHRFVNHLHGRRWSGGGGGGGVLANRRHQRLATLPYKSEESKSESRGTGLKTMEIHNCAMVVGLLFVEVDTTFLQTWG